MSTRWNGTKILVVSDGSGLPIAAAWLTGASPHEVTLPAATLAQGFLDDAPEHLIGDRAFDVSPLVARLRHDRITPLIAPHRRHRKRPKTQDGAFDATGAPDDRTDVHPASHLPSPRDSTGKPCR
jgi:hypothetical protein